MKKFTVKFFAPDGVTVAHEENDIEAAMHFDAHLEACNRAPATIINIERAAVFEQVTTQSCNAAPTVSLEKLPVVATLAENKKVDLTKSPAFETVQDVTCDDCAYDYSAAKFNECPHCIAENRKVDLRKKVDLTKRPFAAPLPIDGRTNAQLMESARARVAAFRANPMPLRTEMSATDYLSRVAIQTAMGDCL